MPRPCPCTPVPMPPRLTHAQASTPFEELLLGYPNFGGLGSSGQNLGTSYSACSEFHHWQPNPPPQTDPLPDCQALPDSRHLYV
eukprot:1160974-Pelagomonas_calceolata.AAC.7